MRVLAHGCDCGHSHRLKVALRFGSMKFRSRVDGNQ
jgi:hypothetical protein